MWPVRGRPLGLAMVLLAGFAREYDQESLLHEPLHLLIPAAASVTLSLVIWMMCWRTMEAGTWPPVLRCIWFCSPMALLYAIPFERSGDPIWSTKLNLASLGIVSMWRMLLMIRIVSVLQGISIGRAFFQLMWIVDTLVIVAMVQLKIPLLHIMGGIQFTPVEQILSDVQGTVVPLAIMSWPVWMILYFVSCYTVPGPAPVKCPDSSVDRRTWWPLAGGLVLAIAGVLWAQPQQQNRYRVEQLVRQGKYDEAMNELCRVPREEFPLLWEPPPRFLADEGQQLFAMTHAFIQHPAPPPWVKDHIEDRLTRTFGNRYLRGDLWREGRPEYFEDLLVMMDQSPLLVTRLDGREEDNSSEITQFVSRQMMLNEFPDRRDRGEPIVPLELLPRLLKHARRLPEGPQIPELEKKLQKAIEASAQKGTE
jgi:hypothetical protein